MADNVTELKTPAEPARQLGVFEQFRAFLGVISRTRMGRLLTSFAGTRNYQEIFGWDPDVTYEMMLQMYNRGGIAKRVVDSYPDATWARPPVIWAKGDDAWTEEWANFTQDSNLWPALYRLDRITNLGYFGLLLIGTDRPALEMPLRNARKITFLQPYGEGSVRIEQLDDDETSPTFNQPILYRIYPHGRSFDPKDAGSTVPRSRRKSRIFPGSSFVVHASRVLHTARGSLQDDIYGQPTMLPVWDYLTDLRKVIGSSSESYWLMANRGIQADVDKEMSLNADDAAALQTELDEFFNGFRRFIRSKGVTIKEFQNDVADPQNPFNVLVTLISGTSGIPKRILLGSEAGQLASTQDKGNWAERVEENRALYVEPAIIKPFLRFALNSGIMRKPNTDSNGLNILWPDAYRQSPLERGQTAAQTARTIANITKMLESKAQEARELMNREEIRSLLGFPSENRILRDNPDP